MCSSHVHSWFLGSTTQKTKWFQHVSGDIWRFPKIWLPKMMVYIWKNMEKPPTHGWFGGTPISGNPHVHDFSTFSSPCVLQCATVSCWSMVGQLWSRGQRNPTGGLRKLGENVAHSDQEKYKSYGKSSFYTFLFFWRGYCKDLHTGIL